jgi:hypothetical protein
MPGTATRRAWALALLRTALAVIAYAIGASLRVFPQWGLELNITAGALCGLLTFVVEYITGVRPARHWQERVPDLLDDFVHAICFLDQLSETIDAPLRLRVMVLGRRWRWLGLRRYFTTGWSQGMEGRPDAGMIFPIGQGIIGRCFRTGLPVYYNRAQAAQTTCRLSRRLRLLTADLQAIIAFPIFEPRRGGRESGRLRGVLTLDSTAPHAGTVLTSQGIHPLVETGMRVIAAYIGRLYA